MTRSVVPIHEFFGAIYGHFFADEQGRPSPLSETIHAALRETGAARVAGTLMDYVAGDIEVQWVGEVEGQAEGASFPLPTAERGDRDLTQFASEHPTVYAEAFQVAVTRLSYRERPTYDAYFALVVDAFERLYGPGSAPTEAG